MPELSPTGEQPEHARECTACAGRLENLRALHGGLRRLSEEQRSIEAPPHMEGELLRQFRMSQVVSEKPKLWPLRWPAWASAALATTLIAGFLIWSQGQVRRVALAPPEDTSEMETGFIPLPNAMDAGADADVIRVELPRSALVAWGVPLVEDDIGESVQAEIALGAGGMPLAVRLVQ
jgi:hypothetical protein